MFLSSGEEILMEALYFYFIFWFLQLENSVPRNKCSIIFLGTLSAIFFSFLYISVGLYTNGTYFTIFLCRTVLNKFHNVAGIVIVIDVLKKGHVD